AGGPAELHAALLDDVIGIDREDVTARLIAPHRHFRHQKRGPWARRHSHANEIARQQSVLGIFENAAHLQRPGRLVDIWRCVVEQAFVRIAGLGLQAHLDRYLVDELGGAHTSLGHGSAHALHIAFAQVEPDPDRVELHDAGKLTRLLAADQLAYRNLARGDHAV